MSKKFQRYLSSCGKQLLVPPKNKPEPKCSLFSKRRNINPLQINKKSTVKYNITTNRTQRLKDTLHENKTARPYALRSNRQFNKSNNKYDIKMVDFHACGVIFSIKYS